MPLWKRFRRRSMAPRRPAVFSEQVTTVCDVYAAAPLLEATGTHVFSTDEMTGIQALERAAPTLPMQPGRVERREFEDIRRGTQSLLANFQVATGQVEAGEGGDRPDAVLEESKRVDHAERE